MLEVVEARLGAGCWGSDIGSGSGDSDRCDICAWREATESRKGLRYEDKPFSSSNVVDEFEKAWSDCPKRSRGMSGSTKESNGSREKASLKTSVTGDSSAEWSPADREDCGRCGREERERS